MAYRQPVVASCTIPLDDFVDYVAITLPLGMMPNLAELADVHRVFSVFQPALSARPLEKFARGTGLSAIAFSRSP